jgi:hypothetical protein
VTRAQARPALRRFEFTLPRLALVLEAAVRVQVSRPIRLGPLPEPGEFLDPLETGPAIRLGSSTKPLRPVPSVEHARKP